MRLILIVLQGFLVVLSLSAQKYYPIKVNKKWGLIDQEGRVILAPVYDAIGEFKDFGYAIMQRQSGVGLLDRSGREVVRPVYDDLKVLDSLLISVMDHGEWMVINLKGETVLDKGYDRVQVWDGRFLAFRKAGQWGVVDYNGRVIAEPVYDDILLEQQYYFLTRKGDALGLLSETGEELLTNQASEIKILSDSLFFFKDQRYWGAVDHHGKQLIPAEYESFSRISQNFIKLVAKGRSYAYSISCNAVLTDGSFENFYPFSRKYVIAKKDRRLGLLDGCGNLVLTPQYSEIQAYGPAVFRVNYQGKWGVVEGGDKIITPFVYDYITPLRAQFSLIKNGAFFGLINTKGKEVVRPVYDRIEVEDGKAKAYRKGMGSKEALTLFHFDAEGNIVHGGEFDNHFTVRISGKRPAGSSSAGEEDNEYWLDHFEWFYSPERDRWGLRRLSDGGIQIEPLFHFILPQRELGFTVVGIEKSTRCEFERTTFRFEMVFGIVRNDMGLLVTDVDFWDIRLSDFQKGYPVARCIMSNGRHGLLDRQGKLIRQDFAYIGSFSDGVARMSMKGKLSGSLKNKNNIARLDDYLDNLMAPSFMVDYTKYDQVFQKDAGLICEDCEWGYLDTAGSVVVVPQYSFAQDFVNEVGIVECNGKWGMVDRQANVLIPCRYDEIGFLENTNNKIVRIHIKEPKYGLIDTLGQLTVSTIYDEIGQFSEGRLAVMRNGMWGFVNRDGLEVIPCRFREVQNFSEGLAAVKLGNYWGYIDKQGNVEIDFRYRRAGLFKDGLAWVYDKDGIGYIDRGEKTVIPPQFDRAFDFYRGVARVMVNGEFGLIDRSGKFLLRPRFTDIQPFNQHGLAVVRYGKERVRYGVIDLKGNMVTRRPYREIGDFKEGLASVRYLDGYGFIDTTGTLVIPAVYSRVSSFSEGRAAAQKDGQCGYITRTGQKVISFEFSKCLDFNGGKAVVYKGIRRAGLIDVQGNQILEPSIDRLLQFREGRGLVRDEKYRFYYITENAGWYNGYYQEASEFKYGVAVVQVDGQWGIINQRGVEIIPPKYDKIESFEDGYAKVRVQGFSGLTNLKGELIIQPTYEYISYAGEGIFRVEQGDKVGYFDLDGNWVWDLSK